MKTLYLTTDNALLLNERELQDGNIKYQINTSTINVNNKRVLAEMTVDGFVDGEWEHELSCAYQLGETINVESDDWLKLI